MPNRVGRPSAAQTPAPKSERIYGSKKNRKGSATSKNAKSIQLSKDTIDILKDKLNEFKKNNPDNNSITLNDLKAVYRRGSGAYSSSHRPTITGGAPNSRAAWSMARVNKFLKKASGEKVKAAYIQDDDLMKDGGLVNSLTVGMDNLKKNGIVLTDKEKMYTVITYNTGGQERSGALYNKALIYRSVLHLRQANEIIDMFDNEAYQSFDESKMAQYKSSPYLIILNQNEVVYDSEKQQSHTKNTNKMANGGTIKWQDAVVGDNALVKETNKMGVIMQAYGRKFHLKFVDGTEKTYDAKEIEFYGDKMAKGGWIGSYKKQIKTADVPEFLNETKDDGHKYSLWNKGVGTTYAYNGKLYANNGEVLPKGTVINLNDRMDFWAKANCETLFLEDEKLVVLPEKQDKYNCYTTGYDGMRSKYGNEDNVTLKEAVDFCWHYTEVKNKYATKEDLEKEIKSTPYGKENVISSTGNISGVVVYKLSDKQYAQGGIVSSSDIIEGAKFKTSSGIVWCIDKVEEPDVDSGLVVVSTSMQSGKKGNYKDEISEVAAFLNEEGAVKMAKGGAVSKEFKFEGTERELIMYLQSRRDKNAIHANIFQSNGYILFIFDANDILLNKKFKTHDEARIKLNEWIDENAKNNKEKYSYGTIADIADTNNYYFSVFGDVPKEVFKEKMANGGRIDNEEFSYIQNKVMSGDLIVDNSGILKSYAWHSKDGGLNVRSEDKSGVNGNVYQLYTIKVHGEEDKTTREYSEALIQTHKYFQQKMAKGGVVSRYRIVLNKARDGKADFIEPDYKKAMDFDGSVVGAEAAAMNFLLDNISTHVSANVTKIHSSGNAMKNKKVMIVEPNYVQRFEQGGEIEEAGEVIRPMFIGDAVVYEDSTWYITQKDGLLGIMSFKKGAWGSDYPFIPLGKIRISEELRDMMGRKVSVEGIHYAKGGAIAGEWVVYNGINQKWISTRKSHRSALMMQNKLMESGNYESVGIINKAEWDASNGRTFKEGGMLFPKELQGQVRVGNIWGNENRKYTTGVVNLEDLKVMPLGVDLAKETFEKNKKFQPTSKPIIVGVDVITGQKQLLDGYHRWYAKDGKGRKSAIFIPMKNGDIISFDEMHNQDSQDPIIALPDTQCSVSRLNEILSSQGYVIQKNNNNGSGEMQKMDTGGVVVGKRHHEMDEHGNTGETFVVEDTGEVVEVEGGEGVLCTESMQSDKLYDFEGDKLTGREIASILNSRYGGVKFAKGGKVSDCGCNLKYMYKHGGELPSATLESLHGGNAVVTVKTMQSQDKYGFQGTKKTPREILSRINADHGGKKFEEGGMLDFTNYDFDILNKMTKMVYFTEKIAHY